MEIEKQKVKNIVFVCIMYADLYVIIIKKGAYLSVISV